MKIFVPWVLSKSNTAHMNLENFYTHVKKIIIKKNQKIKKKEKKTRERRQTYNTVTVSLAWPLRLSRGCLAPVTSATSFPKRGEGVFQLALGMCTNL